MAVGFGDAASVGVGVVDGATLTDGVGVLETDEESWVLETEETAGSSPRAMARTPATTTSTRTIIIGTSIFLFICFTLPITNNYEYTNLEDLLIYCITMPQKPTLLVVIGPTASGKSEYAVKLAKKYNGEIISADSQQVYRGLDIGTGKVPGKWHRASLILNPLSLTRKSHGLELKSQVSSLTSIFIYKSIPHHVIDFVAPKKQYTVADFKRDGSKAILDILARGKTPIICGGTGQYVDALILNQTIPEVVPNPKLRTKLEKKTPAQLFSLLQKKDPVRAASIDRHNPRRLIRALEIIAATGKPVPPPVSFRTSASEIRNPEISKSLVLNPMSGHGVTQLSIKIHYINPPREELNKRIEKRLKGWLKEGLLKEIKRLRAKRVSWKRIEQFGLEYKYASQHIRGLIDYNTMYNESLKSIKNYAKRQQTWFKKYVK